MTPDIARRQLLKVAKLYKLSKMDLSRLTGHPYSSVRRWYDPKKTITAWELFDLANAVGYDMLIKRKKNYAD